MGSGNGTALEVAEYEKKNGAAAHGAEPPRGKSTIIVAKKFFFITPH